MPKDAVLSAKRRALAIDVNDCEVLKVVTTCPDIAGQNPHLKLYGKNKGNIMNIPRDIFP
jgi:hypothetical protein